MKVIFCQSCGIQFGVHARVYANWAASGRGFFCPNGHVLQFNKPIDPPAVEALQENATRLGAEVVTLKGDLVDARQRAELLEAKLESAGGTP